jgi:hypothetical protein
MTIDEILKNKADNPPMEMPSGIKSLIDKVLSYATSSIGGARGQTRAQGDALTNVAQIAGGVYGHQLASDSATKSNLVSMRGQDLSSEADKSKVNVLQGQLDLEKKKANTPYLGVMEEKPTTDWMSIYNKFLKM